MLTTKRATKDKVNYGIELNTKRFRLLIKIYDLLLSSWPFRFFSCNCKIIACRCDSTRRLNTVKTMGFIYHEYWFWPSRRKFSDIVACISRFAKRKKFSERQKARGEYVRFVQLLYDYFCGFCQIIKASWVFIFLFAKRLLCVNFIIQRRASFTFL